MGTDYAFLRLKPSFALANQLGDSPTSKFNYHNIIQLLPTETYFQTTNSGTDIAFAGNIKVELIDCSQIVLLDITNSVLISEFTDQHGVKQISFEILPLIQDFYNVPVWLKFTHTTSDNVWYSNPFTITAESIEETTRFDYKSYRSFHGTDYPRANFMQSIRLKCWFDRPIDETETKDYYQITNGKTISTRALLKESEIYKFDYVNPFVFRQANVLLIHDVIYIDGVRMTNKTTLKSGERLGQSNLIPTEFIVCKNYSDTYEFAYQIFEPLQIVYKDPIGVHSLSSVPTSLNFAFNRNVVIATGTISIYAAIDDSVVASFNQTEMTPVFSNGFTIDITGIITVTGDYYVKISNGLFSSGTEVFAGINNTTDWVFTIVEADYDDSDYDSNDYLT